MWAAFPPSGWRRLVRDRPFHSVAIKSSRSTQLAYPSAGEHGLAVILRKCRLLWPSGPADYRNAQMLKPAVIFIFLDLVNQKNAIMVSRFDEKSQRRQCLMLGPSLPAPSLRGRPASLRTFPDNARGRIPKRLIYRELSAISPVFSVVQSIFLPALREALRSAAVPAAAERGCVPDRTRTCDPQFRKLLLYPTELRGRRQAAYSSGALFATRVKLMVA